MGQALPLIDSKGRINGRTWTDGVCWDVNEDGVPSTKPTHWKPLA